MFYTLGEVIFIRWKEKKKIRGISRTQETVKLNGIYNCICTGRIFLVNACLILQNFDWPALFSPQN